MNLTNQVYVGFIKSYLESGCKLLVAQELRVGDFCKDVFPAGHSLLAHCVLSRLISGLVSSKAHVLCVF